MGIEPTSSAWKAEALPLCYTRIKAAFILLAYTIAQVRVFCKMNSEKNSFSPLLDCRLSQHDYKGFPAGLLRLDYCSGVDQQSDWALLLPPKPGVQTWVVVIHGHGSRGNQLYVRPDLQQHWLPEYLRRGFGILTPTLRGNAWMSPAAVEDMDALLSFVRQKFAAEKFLFSSGSMGGTSNLIYGSLRPHNVAGIIARGAVCDLAAYHAFCRSQPAAAFDQAELAGTQAIRDDIADSLELHYGGTPAEKASLYQAHSPLFHSEKLQQIPIYLAHGCVDELMPISQSRRLAGALADHPRFIYIEIPYGNHDSPLTFGLTNNSTDEIRQNFSALDWIT
jgi:pimeloyl-ACP methyl ester carboxylesterase